MCDNEDITEYLDAVVLPKLEWQHKIENYFNALMAYVPMGIENYDKIDSGYQKGSMLDFKKFMALPLALKKRIVNKIVDLVPNEYRQGRNNI